MQQEPADGAQSASDGAKSEGPGDNTRASSEPGLTIEFVYRPMRKMSTADLAHFGRFTDQACRRVFQRALIRTLRPEILEELQVAARDQPFQWSASTLRDLPPLYDELIELELGSLRARTAFLRSNGMILAIALFLLRVPAEKAFERSHVEKVLEDAMSTMVFDPVDRVVIELERVAKGTGFTRVEVTQPEGPTHLHVILHGFADRDRERTTGELVDEALARLRRRGKSRRPAIPTRKAPLRR